MRQLKGWVVCNLWAALFLACAIFGAAVAAVVALVVAV